MIATRSFPSGSSALWLYLCLLAGAQYSGALLGTFTLALVNAGLVVVLLNDYQWRVGGVARDLRLPLALTALAGVFTALLPCSGDARLIGSLRLY